MIVLLVVVYALASRFRRFTSDNEWTTLRYDCYNKNWSSKSVFCRRCLRALLVLCPLLGCNYVFTIYQPTRWQWLASTIAFYSLIINATQGALISLFFCFNNEEIRACIGRSLAELRVSLSTKVHEMRRKSCEDSTITFLGPGTPAAEL